MSDGRKKLSGHEYQKRAAAKSQKENQVLAKTRKLESFFLKKQDDAIDTEEKVHRVTLNEESPENLLEGENITGSSSGVSTVQSFNDEDISNEENVEETTVSDQKSSGNDPALWIIDDFLRDHIASNGYKQNENEDFTTSKRVYEDGITRYLSKNLFTRKLLNGEKMPRPWLVFSESKGSVFCVPCLLFNHYQCAFNAKDGYNDWKHAVVRANEHENSSFHKQSISDLKQRAKIRDRIDNELIAQMDKEIDYWRNVLRRVISAVKSLASRGLSFRGTNEKFGCTNNGNFMMLLEYLAEFDPFLANHINNFGGKGSGNTNYLSKTVYEELIQLIAEKLTSAIVDEIKLAKYFSIVVDSTSDISHIDQLSFIIRYVKSDGSPVERFLKFFPNPGHKAEELAKAVTVTLDNFGLNVSDCRGQSYDNASNMSGAFSGLQARLKQLNKHAEYVPCAPHSLNLVGVHAAESCSEATSFFATVQSLYNFFTASTHRWEILQTQTQKKSITLKSLSATRWSARMDAVDILHKNFSEIIDVLIKFEEDLTEKAITREEAKGLRCQLEHLETAFMQILWHSLLSRFNAVNLHLQSVNISIAEVIDDYNSLIKYVADTREQYDFYEKKALEVSESQTFRTVVSRKRKLQSDETRDGEVELTGRDRFRINTFNVILDNLLSELKSRCVAYTKIHEKFAVLTMFKDLNISEIRSEAGKLRKIYDTDLESSFDEECIHFHAHCVQKNLLSGSPLEMSKILRSNELYTVFPNVEIAYRMFVCTAVSNCSAERSFSCLKSVKSYLRSSMNEDRLSNLAILCIESKILSSLNTEDLITEFAPGKARQKCF